MSNHGPVVLFAAELSGNGVARNTAYLAQAFQRRGVEVEVACLSAGALEADFAGVRLSALGRGEGPRLFSLVTRTAALRRLLTDRDPSLVVSMGNHAHLSIWAALRGLPSIHRAYRVSNDPRHPGEPVLLARLRALGLALVAADADRLACVSGALADLPMFGAARRQGRVAVTTNGVDPRRIRGLAAARVDHPWIADGAPYVIAVGRVHPQKGYDTLLEALALARRTDPTMRLMIVGGGSRRRVKALRATARTLGLGEDALRLEGEQANPFPLLSRAAAFVLPSRWEGASNSLLEALACGVPVVAARTAGNAALVLGEGRFGRLVEVQDVAGLASAMLDQASPGPARVLPGERVEAFAINAAVDRLVEVLLAARAPQPVLGEATYATAAA